LIRTALNVLIKRQCGAPSRPKSKKRLHTSMP